MNRFECIISNLDFISNEMKFLKESNRILGPDHKTTLIELEKLILDCYNMADNLVLDVYQRGYEKTETLASKEVEVIKE